MSLIERVKVPEGERGPWKVQRFTIPKDDFYAFKLAFEGRSPGHGEFTRLVHVQRGVVMSDTQAEQRDHYDFVREATNRGGHIHINGLGIGMALNAILKSDKVERVTVLELDPDVIALTAPTYTVDPRVTIVQGDAMEYRPPKGERFSAVWHDIWDTYSDFEHEQSKTLHRRWGRAADWQGSWLRERYLSDLKRGRYGRW